MPVDKYIVLAEKEIVRASKYIVQVENSIKLADKYTVSAENKTKYAKIGIVPAEDNIVQTAKYQLNHPKSTVPPIGYVHFDLSELFCNLSVRPLINLKC